MSNLPFAEYHKAKMKSRNLTTVNESFEFVKIFRVVLVIFSRELSVEVCPSTEAFPD